MKRVTQEIRVFHEDKKDYALPPDWCSSICTNSMNELCVEDCALRRDCSQFKPYKDLDMVNLPRFHRQEFIEELNPKERTIILGIYISAIVDFLQGYENERPINRKTVRRVPHSFKVDGLHSDSAQADPVREALREAYRNKKNGLGNMAGQEKGS